MALLTTLFGAYCKQPLLKAIAPEIDIQELEENAAKKIKKN